MDWEINKDAQKGYELRVPVEMWYKKVWAYEGDKESKALHVLRESMLTWWRRMLTREFAQVIRRSSGSQKHVGSIQRIREVAGEYVWIERSWDSYLQDIREMIKNKYWEAGVDNLEQAMGSSF